jgi:hypothetical protein
MNVRQIFIRDKMVFENVRAKAQGEGDAACPSHQCDGKG